MALISMNHVIAWLVGNHKQEIKDHGNNMPVSGRPSSRRPLLTSKEEYYLRDELWRCKCDDRRAEIKKQLAEIDEIRRTSSGGAQHD